MKNKIAILLLSLIIGCDKKPNKLENDYFTEKSCFDITSQRLTVGYLYGINKVSSHWEGRGSEDDGRCNIHIELYDNELITHVIATLSPVNGAALLREEIIDSVIASNIFAYNLSYSITLPMREHPNRPPVNTTFHALELRNYKGKDKHILHCDILKDTLEFDIKHPFNPEDIKASTDNYKIKLSDNNSCEIDLYKTVKYKKTEKKPNLEKNINGSSHLTPYRLRNTWDEHRVYFVNINFIYKSGKEKYIQTYNSKVDDAIVIKPGTPPGTPKKLSF